MLRVIWESQASQPYGGLVLSRIETTARAQGSRVVFIDNIRGAGLA
jgi:hypothetical protein